VKLAVADLARALSRQLAPLYLVFGDEPLQVGESVAAIRTAARARGFQDWELFFVQPGFDWSMLRDSAVSMPLFGGARVLDVRMPDKPDQDGAAFLAEYAAAPSPDCLLVLSAGKLTQDEQKKAWFQACERTGAVVQVRDLTGRALVQWLDQRMNAKGLLADQAGLGALAARVEGNLLAAAQEIEKLHILYGPGAVDVEQISAAVADSARFDVFALVDAVLGSRLVRARRILEALQGEGTPPAFVLWALSREARALAGIIVRTGRGESLDSACARQTALKIFGGHKALIAQAAARIDVERSHTILRLCAAADRKIKGEQIGDAWDGLLEVCAAFCGFPGLRAS